MPRLLLAIALGATQIACPNDDPPPSGDATIEVDFRTIPAVVGSDPLVTAVVTGCKGTPPVLTFADGVLIHRDEAVVLFRVDGEMDIYPEGALLFTVLIPQRELTPDLFGLPVQFDLEMRVFCQDEWVKSSPFPMSYIPAMTSLYPRGYNANRFWASDSDVGDILACVDNKLTNFQQGNTAREELEVEFPCSVTTMSPGLGVRRYLEGKKQGAGTKGVGIAAIDPGPTLAWTRPLALVDSWNDPDRDPVIIREVGDFDELLVLDRETGEDKVGPLSLTHKPLGPIARNADDDILILETSVTGSPDPETRTYWVETFDSVGVQLDLLQVTFYNYRAASYVATFDLVGEHVYIAAAPDNEDTFWIEKVELGTGSTVWSTTSNQPWRYPLGEASGRLVVASEDDFVWLDIDTGAEASQPFGPDSGNSFSRGYVEADGSIVMLADAVGEVSQGLYVFAPDGTTTFRFHEGSSLFRWLAPAWEEGSLVSHLDEIHWLYSRAGYDYLLEQ